MITGVISETAVSKSKVSCLSQCRSSSKFAERMSLYKLSKVTIMREPPIFLNRCNETIAQVAGPTRCSRTIQKYPSNVVRDVEEAVSSIATAEYCMFL